MNPIIASGLITVIGGIVIALITKRQNEKGQRATTALAERTVDREEFDSITRELRQTITDLRADLTDERTARREAEQRIDDLEHKMSDESNARQRAEQRAARAEQRADEAEKRATRLERRVSQLEQVLREHDIPVPPVSDE